VIRVKKVLKREVEKARPEAHVRTLSAQNLQDVRSTGGI
jgi:hypothetical protein